MQSLPSCYCPVKLAPPFEYSKPGAGISNIARDQSRKSEATGTNLTPQKRDRDRLSVLIDDKYTFSTQRDEVAECGTSQRQVLSSDAPGITMATADDRAAYETALVFIVHKPRTEREVYRRLLRSNYDEYLAERTIDLLRTRGYLDDAAYARQYVSARFASRGYGPIRLRSELVRRGVDRRHVDAALDELEHDDVLQAARNHLQKRANNLSETNPLQRINKLTDYLRRRGFSADVVGFVMKEWTECNES